MIKYSLNKSSLNQIKTHLEKCSEHFIPPLNKSVDINNYSKKIEEKSIRFEAWQENELIGFIAVYIDNPEFNFITNVSVLQKFKREGIASKLINRCIDYSLKSNKKSIKLEVWKSNEKALSFYHKHNFKIVKEKYKKYTMSIETKRDYNKEFKDNKDRKYAYNFDFDVMHHYMIQSFIPFFRKGNLLELGSFKGDFTKRLKPLFDDITCVEASEEAIEISKTNLGEEIKFIHTLFEDANLPMKYDNIILTHVLEHLDDPISVLKRINNEWLSENGRLFLVCPNANAPSRQIAVKMGLISHNSAVTQGEKEHGHHITYSLDTLERDAKKAGLKVTYRTGIFFKSLANFQWDRLLKTDIISKEYLDGCFQLGHQYPDLCSSIFLLCEKG